MCPEPCRSAFADGIEARAAGQGWPGCGFSPTCRPGRSWASMPSRHSYFLYIKADLRADQAMCRQSVKHYTRMHVVTYQARCPQILDNDHF
jgi:hypothetical protein